MLVSILIELYMFVSDITNKHFFLFVSVGDMGTPTRTRKYIDLPVSVLMQPRVEDTSEVEVKMKQIMKMSGLLTIDNIVSTMA